MQRTYWARVPISDLETLPIGLQSIFRRKLNSLLKIDLPFEVGELVRFRDATGKMDVGYIHAQNGAEIQIKKISGEIQSVSSEEVFKRYKLGDKTALTPQYRDVLIPEKAGMFPGEGYDAPQGAYRDLLNAAAKTNSTMLTHGASELDITRVMVDLVNTTIESNTYGWGATDFGATSIQEIVCIGGVCRHKSRVIASMLSEMGLKPKIMYGDESLIKELIGQNGGHEWIEVDLRNASGKTEPYVVDAMHPDKVFPLSKSQGQVVKETDPAKIKIHAVYRSARKVEQCK